MRHRLPVAADPDDHQRPPDWVNYTGGDTLWSVAVTPAAVYVGGHQRWLDNPYCNNCAGPDAVPAKASGRSSPVRGKAMAWNPGRARGVGAQELVATSRGLYVGLATPSGSAGSTTPARDVPRRLTAA